MTEDRLRTLPWLTRGSTDGGVLRPALRVAAQRANPWSQSIFRGYKASLPTSLTHIDYCSTRGNKPWRPDEVYGTVGTVKPDTLAALQDQCGETSPR